MSVRSPAQAAATCRVTGPRVLRSEWAKLWSLRSTWASVGLALLFIGALGLLGAYEYAADFREAETSLDAVGLSLFGVDFAQLALGALGVLVTAGEYSTGLIRSTLAAVPRRLPVLYAKATVYGMVALVVGAVAAVLTFLGAGVFLAGTRLALSITDDGVLRSLLGAGVYLGLVGVIGVALGALLRSVAAGITVLIAVLLLVPGLIAGLAQTFPGSVWEDIQRYLPSVAGRSLYALKHYPDTLTPAAALLVLAAWALLTMAGAAVRLMRSDA